MLIISAIAIAQNPIVSVVLIVPSVQSVPRSLFCTQIVATCTEKVAAQETFRQVAVVTRIVLADEHQLFRESLRWLLEVQSDLEVVGEAADGLQAISQTIFLQPDVLLLDLALPRLTAINVLFELARRKQTTAAMLVTSSITPSEFLSALAVGAKGAVMKQWPASTLLDGIRVVAAGHYWIGRQRVTNVGQARQLLSQDASQKAVAHRFGLTRRELEVTAAIVAACSNKVIAERFSMSEKTVKHHLTNIFDKVGVSSRLELAVFARHHGIVLPDIESRIQKAG